MLTRPLLRALRNELPMPFTIRQLGSQAPYAKTVEGRFRFVCPRCQELLAILNPRNNLAHCFNCGENINNIDLLLALGYDFREAVALLERHLRQYRREQNQPRRSADVAPASGPERAEQGPLQLGEILRREFGKLARE